MSQTKPPPEDLIEGYSRMSNEQVALVVLSTVTEAAILGLPFCGVLMTMERCLQVVRLGERRRMEREAKCKAIAEAIPEVAT